MLKIIFIGSSTPFALTAFQWLIQNNQKIIALYTPDSAPLHRSKRFPIQVENHETLIQLARLHHIPYTYLDNPIEDYYPQLKTTNADLIITCCFGKRLPASIFTLPSLGSINIHPSLLPQFRGPDPIFWQYKLACDAWGLSLHKITRQFDTGNIVAQQRCDIPDGIHASQCQHILAEAIPELLSLGLTQLKSSPQLSTTQNEHHASTQSHPRLQDYSLDYISSARHTFNFISAYATINTPIKYHAQEGVFSLVKAISYKNDLLFKPIIRNHRITFPCYGGQVTAQFHL